MEKIVTVPGKVDDICGLILDLRRAGFAVRNVGVEPSMTHVYLDEDEPKDPIDAVRSWLGRPPRIFDARGIENLKAEFADVEEIERMRKEEEISKEEKAEAKRSPGIVARIFRKLF